MSIMMDDASFQDKLNGVVAMVRNGMSVMDALLSENILGAWAMDDGGRYEEIVEAGELMAVRLFEPLWELLKKSGLSLSKENKSVLYEDFWS